MRPIQLFIVASKRRWPSVSQWSRRQVSSTTSSGMSYRQTGRQRDDRGHCDGRCVVLTGASKSGVQLGGAVGCVR